MLDIKSFFFNQEYDQENDTYTFTPFNTSNSIIQISSDINCYINFDIELEGEIKNVLISNETKSIIVQKNSSEKIKISKGNNIIFKPFIKGQKYIIKIKNLKFDNEQINNNISNNDIIINNAKGDNIFDWQQYINNYEDLKKAGINTHQKAWNHWIKYGMKEGRNYNNILISDNSINNLNYTSALLFHVYNYDVFIDIINKYKIFFERKDLIIFITTSIENNINKIKKILPTAIIQLIENKGADIGGFLINASSLIKNKYYSQIKYIYVFHTKTIDEWRNMALKSIIDNYIIIENDWLNKDIPLLFGPQKYCYENYRDINNYYINKIYYRNKSIFDKYFNQDDLFSYFDISFINNSFDKSFNIFLPNYDFYRYYELDLRNMNILEAEKHYKKFGINEYHRINNPCYIKNFLKESYFVAGTMFCCNIEYFKIFENIDFNFEFNILETGYNLNNIPRKTHSWEYLFGLLAYARNGYIICENNFKMLNLNDKFDIDIYKNFNFDLKNLDYDLLKNHFYQNGIKENRIYCKNQIFKKQANINIDIHKAKIVFFLNIPIQNDNNYIKILKYINLLLINNINVDLYFGNSISDIETYFGLSKIKNNIDDIIEIIKNYGCIDNYLDINYYLGLNLQLKYNILVVTNSNIDEVANLNKINVNKIVYFSEATKYIESLNINLLLNN